MWWRHKSRYATGVCEKQDTKTRPLLLLDCMHKLFSKNLENFQKKERQKKKCLHFLEIETRRPSIQKLYIKKLKTLFWLLYYSLIIFNYQIALVRTSPWIWHRSLLLPFQSYYALLSIVHPILQHMVSIINYINT